MTETLDETEDIGWFGMSITEVPKVKTITGCPKCGETGTFALKREYCQALCFRDGQEHMHVTCDKCGYERGARCMDSVDLCPVASVSSTALDGVEPKAARGERHY